MIFKWLFDRIMAFIGLLLIWPLLLIIAIMIKIKMPEGPVLFKQKTRRAIRKIIYNG